MKIGFIISMYDEIDVVKNSITNIQRYNSPIIVIQSDPKDSSKIPPVDSVDFYEKLPDLAGSKEEYLKERDDHNVKEATTPVKAVTRNYGRAFSVAKNFDVDWWVAILGDVLISDLSGIKILIQKIIANNKSLGITRVVGQVFRDDNHKFTRIQTEKTTDFMPQFFIVKSDLIKNGLFCKFSITNRYTTEQCLGDEVVRYCNNNNTSFSNLAFIISNYAYPQFISGLTYPKDRIRIPRYIDGVISILRRFKIKFSKN